MGSLGYLNNDAYLTVSKYKRDQGRAVLMSMI